MLQAPYSVTQITHYIKDKLESDSALQNIWVEGEISNWTRSRAGHCYFTLKDAQASIRAVLWRTVARRLLFMPQDGHAVLAHGRLSVYEPQGQYQFYVDDLRPVGRGSLYLQFEELKARLAAEGLFETEHKRPLPLFPICIGVVTSPTGAALRDILNVLRRRWPLVHVLLSPTLVQGDRAPSQIVTALQALYDRSDVDLIIVARGGGSIEDLWAFNDERVARQIFQSPVPVISGVGHQVDFTIADFVADVRAPTPSAAAEVAVPDQLEVRAQLSQIPAAAEDAVRHRIREANQDLELLCQAMARLSPRFRLQRDRQRIDDLLRRTDQAGVHRLALLGERLAGLTERLHGLSPYATLRRGYAIVRGPAGRVVRTVTQVAPGDSLSVRVSDGEFSACVEAE